MCLLSLVLTDFGRLSLYRLFYLDYLMENVNIVYLIIAVAHM